MGQTNAAITMICVMTQSSLRSRKVLISLSITTKIQRVVSYYTLFPMGPGYPYSLWALATPYSLWALATPIPYGGHMTPPYLKSQKLVG